MGAGLKALGSVRTPSCFNLAHPLQIKAEGTAWLQASHLGSWKLAGDKLRNHTMAFSRSLMAEGTHPAADGISDEGVVRITCAWLASPEKAA
jgi:hypothetical protein